MGHVLAVTAPIYLLIAAGWALARAGVFAPADLRVLGRYVIQLALPALLFSALSQRSLGEVLQPTFLVAYALGSLFTIGTGLLWARRVAGKGVSASAIVAMGMACSNSGFVGFPMLSQLFGPVTAGAALALAMIVENLLLIPLVLAIAESEGAGEGEGGGRAARLRAALGRSFQGLVRNPMIHGLLLGLLCSLLGVRLPEPVTRAVGLLAASCSALSLVVIGGTLVGVAGRATLRDAAVICAGKLLLHPLAVALLVMVLPPMPRELQVSLVLLAAMPMMGIYPLLAQKYGHESMAAASQLAATVVSFLTLSGLVWLLRPVG